MFMKHICYSRSKIKRYSCQNANQKVFLSLKRSKKLNLEKNAVADKNAGKYLWPANGLRVNQYVR